MTSVFVVRTPETTHALFGRRADAIDDGSILTDEVLYSRFREIYDPLVESDKQSAIQKACEIVYRKLGVKQ